jgi:hypothetical protein
VTFVSHASDEFWELPLPSPDIQKQADKQFERFRLKPVGQVWSARVSQAYRVLGYREGKLFYWFWIGSHKEYERLLGR